MSIIEDETDIDIEEDVFPWLGPEIAMGMRNFSLAESVETEMIFFIGTMNKETSDAFFFDKLIPAMMEVGEEFPTETSGDYNGIDILYDPEGDTCWAFPEEYIILSNSQTFLEGSLDMIRTPNLGASLAGAADFQDAKSTLPERVGMFYFDYDGFWEQTMAQIPPGQILEVLLNEAVMDYIPSSFAASISLTGNGITATAYYPLPEGMTLSTKELDLLKSIEIVPGDTWLFFSAQDMNASWQQIRSLIDNTWQDITADLGERDLPPGMSMGDIATLDDVISWIEEEIGINIDDDIFGWMDGECVFALLPLTLGEYGPLESPDVLFLLEVDDTDAVEIKLEAIVAAINTIMGDGPEALQLTATTIGGVEATLITNSDIGYSPLSPGWLFLDVDTTHYLVIGTTTDALQAAVDASQGIIPSLDEAEEYQGVLGLLPPTRVGLGYINLSQIEDMIVSLIPTEELNADEQALFEGIIGYLPLEWALGLSSAVTEDSVTMTGALYLLPPPLIEQLIEEGTTGIVEIPEQLLDFTKEDTDVGHGVVSMDVYISDAPKGASIEVSAMKEVPQNIISEFELAATDAGVSIVDTAYVIIVDKTNLDAAHIGVATITMKVGKNWADDYGVDNIKIFRIDYGTNEMLPTEFDHYLGDQAVFVGTSENGPSHYFALIAISEGGGANWVLIGGIIGGVIVAALAAMLLLRRRSVA
jgi:hypothetical protein